MKKIGLIVALAIIIGAIWYLDSIKVQPGLNGKNTTPQAINIFYEGLPSASGTTSISAENITRIKTLQSIAAADKNAGYVPAVEIASPTGFINASPGFKISNFIGKKVVLLDFWTYSCINCIRTIPHLNAWYEKYRSQGLEIIGIHTPEFEFEKDYNNVEAAVRKFAIRYPVVLDSDRGTWQAYGNLYWPHEYLIDIDGYIVHDQIGEGAYDETEAEIQKLLEERSEALAVHPVPVSKGSVNVQPNNLSGVGSPETYFGAARNEFLANGNPASLGSQVLKEPESIELNKLYLVGSWNFDNEYATNNGSAAKIIYKYHSAKLYLVASAPGVAVEVLQDGKVVSAAAGSDVQNGKVIIQQSRLYNIISNPDGPEEHTLELIIDSPGLMAYTFTFG